MKKGGSGLRSATLHSPAAFIASALQTRTIVDKILPAHIQRRSLDGAFPLLQTNTANPTYSSIDLLPPNSTQNSLSAEIDANAHSHLLEAADARNKARLRSLSLVHAGDFLDATPSAHLNLNLDSRSFSVAMAYRLGVPIMAASEC